MAFSAPTPYALLECEEATLVDAGGVRALLQGQVDAVHTVSPRPVFPRVLF